MNIEYFICELYGNKKNYDKLREGKWTVDMSM
jgi:hypothetical protein